MRIIAVANHKGGCGKTTTSINLSAGIARKGYLVLLIDMDPQAHSSIGLGINPVELEKTIYDVLLHSKEVLLESIVVKISGSLDVAPSDIVLSGAELELAGVIGREKELARAVSSLKKKYDYVIIDCPPNLGLLTFNSLVAADEVLIPIESSSFALHGVNKLLEVVELLREKLDHPLKVNGLMTMFDRRTNLAKEIYEELKSFFKDRLLKTLINVNVTLREAAAKGVPIFEYDINAAGAKDYNELAEEIISQE